MLHSPIRSVLFRTRSTADWPPELGNSIFKSSFFRRGLLTPKFSAEPVRKALEDRVKGFGDTKLGGSNILTGLAVVAKRLDTGSPWVIHNNPKGRYFNQVEGSSSTPNKDYLLSDVVRASTAAPTYFEPEMIRVSDDMEGAFVDGGVSPHNNPALQLLMLATLKGHKLCWPTGADKLLLVSLGTGSKTFKLDPKEVMDNAAAKLGIRALSTLMEDAGALNELMLQWMSASQTPREIDSEIGDLSEDILGGGKPLLTYLRYDVKFDDAWLKDKLKLTLDAQQLDSIAEMDMAENMDTLVKIGTAAAGRIKGDHFGRGFDIE
ncbi:MAG: patatin-like phospholipase family protein [Burkholderiales bacterium]|nr:patatin-like phospholipase family protein [Burkholderiales bacterium]